MSDRAEREVEGLEYRLRDNQHPNTNGSPWGEIQDGQGRRVAVYSGWSGKERAQEMADALRTLTAERDAARAAADRERRKREGFEGGAELLARDLTRCKRLVHDLGMEGVKAENERLRGAMDTALLLQSRRQVHATLRRALEPDTEGGEDE